MGTDPTFPPNYRGFAALGGSWTSPGMQQPDGITVSGSLSKPFAHRGRSYWLPWAYLRVSRRASSRELVPSAYKSKDI